MTFSTYTLGELVSIKYGKNQKKVLSDNGYIPIYGTGGLMGYATEALYDKPSVLIGRKGTIEKIRYVDHPFWTVDTLFYTIVNEDIVIPQFLYYTMLQLDLLQYNEGTTIPSLRMETLNRIELQIPDIESQKEILRYLATIDNKIALNTAINVNLEQQAQAIFRNLFPDCMLNGIPMSSIIDVRDGTHDSPKSKETGHYLITSKHLQAYSVNKNEANLISDEDYKQINKRSRVEYGDILISMIGTVGLISFVSDEVVDFAIKNVGLFRTSQNELLRYYILNYLKSEEVSNYIEQHLAGSTQKYISLTELRNLPIFIPSGDQSEYFNLLVAPIYSEIVNLCRENQRLSALRDTLLPKLMNGEIDVSEVKI